jgi:hypothetical protein
MGRHLVDATIRIGEVEVQVLYLGISGTLHPSATTYELVVGRSPWSDGHREYEAVPWLEQTMSRWRNVRIILTSPKPARFGMAAILPLLGSVASQVEGFTFEDLTTRPLRQTTTRSGTSRWSAFSHEDYWRMSKSAIVSAHVAWLRPTAWLAVDDESILWSPAQASHVCIVDGCRGLGHPAEQDRLLTYLNANFGRAR